MCNFNKRIYATRITAVQFTARVDHSKIRLNLELLHLSCLLSFIKDIDLLQGTVSVISKDPPCKDGDFRFTKVPLKP